MCGIVGYTGMHEASPILVAGLRRLEYRGYDSAGLAAIEDGRLEVRKPPAGCGSWKRCSNSHPWQVNAESAIRAGPRMERPLMPMPTPTWAAAAIVIPSWSCTMG